MGGRKKGVDYQRQKMPNQFWNSRYNPITGWLENKLADYQVAQRTTKTNW